MAESADSDSETGTGDRSQRLERTKPWETADDVPWTLLTEDELADANEAVIAPALRRDGQDASTDRPSYEWLSTNGYRTLTYTLREHHDTTLATWWDKYVGDDVDEEQGYSWNVEDDTTRESFEQFIDARQRDNEDWNAAATPNTIRTRLSCYAKNCRERHGTDDLISPVAVDSDIDETEAVDKCRNTFRYMRADGNGGDGYAEPTIARVHDAIRMWYEWLVERRVVAFNPTNGAEDWFGWSRSSDDNAVALETAHVQAMYEAAETTRERMLVVALCAWGLRAGEVASLHADQLVLDDERPRVKFEERKNGPGSVVIVYGSDVARDRVVANGDEYLFSSKRSKTGHVHRTTIADWFCGLAERASVPEEIDGQHRKPHMGRRWWYDRYTATLEDLLQHVEEVAAEQGSTSAQVVRDRYLSEERRRELRREFMRDRLSKGFEPYEK